MALFNFGKNQEAEKTLPCRGQTVDGIRSVKVLGTGCKSCHELYENAREAVHALGLSVEVEYITDLEKIMAYGVMSTPAIVVNDKVVSAGKVLKKDGVAALLYKMGGTAT